MKQEYIEKLEQLVAEIDYIEVSDLTNNENINQILGSLFENIDYVTSDEIENMSDNEDIIFLIKNYLENLKARIIVENNDIGSSMSYYRQDMKKFPVLTKEEEVKLCKKIANGDKEAMNELVSHNLPFVVTVAYKFVGRGIDLEDLIEEGNLGLIMAAERYDLSKGYRFLTYARWYVTRNMYVAIRDKSKFIRKSAKLDELDRKADKIKDNYYKENGKNIPLDELKEIAEMTDQQFQDFTNIQFQSVSLNAPTSEEKQSTIGDFIINEESPIPEEEIIHSQLREDLEKIINEKLNEREKDIIYERYGLDGKGIRTCDEIGKKYNVSLQRIDQIEKKALVKLRYPAKKLQDYLY